MKRFGRMTAAQWRKETGADTDTPKGKPLIAVAEKADRTLDGIVFGSAGEMRRYMVLRMKERAGLIRDLQLQPEFVLFAGLDPLLKHKIKIVYTADFYYIELDGDWTVEEFKGHWTDIAKLRVRWFRSLYPDVRYKIVEDENE